MVASRLLKERAEQALLETDPRSSSSVMNPDNLNSVGYSEAMVKQSEPKSQNAIDGAL